MSFLYTPRPYRKEDKRKAIAELLENTVPDRDFYLLVLGAIILAACGILIDSIPVLIASMIVAPFAYPILSLGLGLSNVAKRAITDNANQVFYGYIPGYTLVDSTVNYETKRFLYQVRVDNVLNDSGYIHAARSNQVIVPGAPSNVSGSITYKF